MNSRLSLELAGPSETDYLLCLAGLASQARPTPIFCEERLRAPHFEIDITTAIIGISVTPRFQAIFV